MYMDKISLDIYTIDEIQVGYMCKDKTNINKKLILKLQLTREQQAGLLLTVTQGILWQK